MILAVLAFVLFYALFGISGGRIIDSKNSSAERCLKAVSEYVRNVYEKNGSVIPSDREYIVNGYTNSSGMTIEPCELLENGGKNSNVSDKGVYWAVRFSGGKAVEAWSYHEPLDDNELKHYSRDEQTEKYNKNVFKRGSDVIGYYNADEGGRFYH